MNDSSSRRTSLALAGLCGALGAACVAALGGVGGYYDGFPIPQQGVSHVMPAELAFFAWYGLWGTAATLLVALALVRTPGFERFVERTIGLLSRPRLVVGVAAGAALVFSLGLRQIVLLDEPVADDEMVYAFQAQTLARGRVVNPLPPNPPLFKNQFVLLDDQGWYGKYPIGHPLVLAIGEVTGTRPLLVPALAALSVVLTFLVGRRLFGTPRAALGAALLCISPQFVGTHATLLSQTSSCLFTLLALWAMLRLRDEARLRWALCAGLAWGFVVLVRPLPGVPFVAAAFLGWVAWQLDAEGRARPWLARLQELAAALPGLLIGVGLVLWVNTIETGSPVQSGYSGSTGRHEQMLFRAWREISASFGGALLRQNFWLFGWTLSLAFVAFARPRRGAVLFWGVIAAEYGYRILVPKTVVASTGPIYVFEIVPLLALASADGIARVAAWLGRVAGTRPRSWLGAGVLAASLVALLTFVPTQLLALHRSSVMRVRVYDLLRERDAARALVFANKLVEPEWGATWAYHPPNPSPALDDEVIFLRLPLGPGGVRSIHDFWRAEIPERRAFVYFDAPRGVLFEELDPRTPPSDTASLADVLRARGAGAEPTDVR